MEKSKNDPFPEDKKREVFMISSIQIQPRILLRKPFGYKILKIIKLKYLTLSRR
jgi:hypothetical protein